MAKTISKHAELVEVIQEYLKSLKTAESVFIESEFMNQEEINEILYEPIIEEFKDIGDPVTQIQDQFQAQVIEALTGEPFI